VAKPARQNGSSEIPDMSMPADAESADTEKEPSTEQSEEPADDKSGGLSEEQKDNGAGLAGRPSTEKNTHD